MKKILASFVAAASLSIFGIGASTAIETATDSAPAAEAACSTWVDKASGWNGQRWYAVVNLPWNSCYTYAAAGIKCSYGGYSAWFNSGWQYGGAWVSCPSGWYRQSWWGNASN